MPIKDCSGDVIGVAQVINKYGGYHFTELDEKVSCLDERLSTHKDTNIYFHSFRFSPLISNFAASD